MSAQTPFTAVDIGMDAQELTRQNAVERAEAAEARVAELEAELRRAGLLGEDVPDKPCERMARAVCEAVLGNWESDKSACFAAVYAFLDEIYIPSQERRDRLRKSWESTPKIALGRCLESIFMDEVDYIRNQ